MKIEGRKTFAQNRKNMYKGVERRERVKEKGRQGHARACRTHYYFWV